MIHKHKLKHKYNEYLAHNRCHFKCLEDSSFKLARIWKLCPLYDSYLVSKYASNLHCGIYVKDMLVTAMLNGDYSGD